MEHHSGVRLTPKEFFFYLGILVTLYISAPTLVNLLFNIIDVAYPPVDRYYPIPSISWPVAMLIVVVPVYIVLSWLIQKQLTKEPARRELWIRKWFIYITLFITAVVMAGDLIALLYYFLDGQLITTSFILKVIVVFVVAKSIFVYYISDLRNKLTPKIRLWARIAAFLFVLAAIILGFSVLGSPRTQRLMRIDTQKVQDLESIQSYLVFNHWQQKQNIPNTLTELNDPISSYMVPTDPDTGAPYEYQKVNTNSFKLCTTFNLPSRPQQNGARGDMMTTSRIYPHGTIDENWTHGAGRVCSDRTIDPELYPPIKR